MQDRPTASELVAAVREFLQQEVLPTLDDHRRKFRALIAANVLAVVERELAEGDAGLREQWRRLSALLDKTDAPEPSTLAELHAALAGGTETLCTRIRAGEADAGPWRAAALAYARWTVEQKLRVANPRYLQRFGGDGA